MKAILLAAGMGTRISKHIKEVPKCFLLIQNDKSLIRMNVEKMIKRGIEPIVCVGYKKTDIYEELKGLPVKYYYNPFYAVTNSIASLWFAQKEIDDDLIIMNADVYFSDEILDKLIDNKHEFVLVSDKTRTEVGDYFFKLNDENRIIRYGKDIPVGERSCEYVGMAKISKNCSKMFKDRLDVLINKGEYTLWWENVLYSFTEENTNLVNTMDVEGHFWGEIDFLDDYNRILNYVKNKK